MGRGHTDDSNAPATPTATAASAAGPTAASTADEQFDDFLWDIDLTARRPRAGPPAQVRPTAPQRPAAPQATRLPPPERLPIRQPEPARPQASEPAPPPASDPHAHTHPRYRSAQPSAPAEAPRNGRGRFFRPELEPGWRRLAANPYLQLTAGTLLASATAYLVVVALTR
ncbi:hypothetical protein N1028_19250 [Herbiconiux sp. CPCC 203407]|uniref:Uncharacterized protein n=1 Tax=Herbiconiux oxytropis TaxID=2970915 RepID=A0AA41XK01_9MICO|nr:hypothetical protein [Herbiconiux oxytropis]MCS5723954.1 hypothetical protein [Herbiconiux oxytropis]MCS5728040.1 hypothetical protein [Herbiconiux oxytropis]